MARARGNKQYTSFSQGLITEASLLDFPEGATSDELNFLYETFEQKRVRRKGISPESDYVFRTSIGGHASTYSWDSQGLLAYTTRNELNSTAVLVLVDTETLEEVWSLGFTPDTNTYTDFTEINEGLIVTLGTGQGQLFLEVDGNTLNIYRYNLYVRDFKLIDDQTQVTERPSTLSDEHRYNLYNAGWWQDRKSPSSGNNLVDPIESFAAEGGASGTFAGEFSSAGGYFETTSAELQAFSSLANGSDIIINNTLSNNGTYTKAGFTASGVGTVYYRLLFNEVIIDETAASANILSSSGGYPSNADIVYLGMRFSQDGIREFFDTQRLIEQTFGNSVAPRGHYIYNISDFTRQDRLNNKTVDGAPGQPLELIGTAPL